MANRDMSLNLGLPSVPQVLDEAIFKELVPVYNAVTALALALDAYTGHIPVDSEFRAAVGVDVKVQGMARAYMNFAETIALGELCRVYSGGVRLAIDGTHPCNAFCSIAATIGNAGEVTFIGLMPEFAASSFTEGNTYYTSAVTHGALSSAGLQSVGFAITDALFFFNPDYQ